MKNTKLSSRPEFTKKKVHSAKSSLKTFDKFDFDKRINWIELYSNAISTRINQILEKYYL